MSAFPTPHGTEPAFAPPASPARCFALIPSAGVGARARTEGQPAWPKQYQALCGRPVLAHTLAAFEALGPALSGVAVVLSPEDSVWAQVMTELAAPSAGQAVTLLRCGGASRADSVRQGLAAWCAQPDGPQPQDWVLVHDAARCLVTPAQIQALMDACLGDAVGGLLALPLADTLKTEVDGRVSHTMERAHKWLAHTPQMFSFGALAQALEAAAAQGAPVTDEASAMEAQGLAPRLVAGSAHNFKITYPQDFSLAEAVLHARSLAKKDLP